MRASRYLPLPVFILGLILTSQVCGAQAAVSKDEPEVIEIRDQLSTMDPIDRLTQSHHKVHVVKLLAGKTYQITLLRKDDKQALTPYLRVEDAAGKELLAQNNFQMARVKFTAPKDETYRFITSGGIGEYVLRIAPSIPIKVLKDHDPAKTIEMDKAGFELTNRLTDKDPHDPVRKGMFAKVFLVKMAKDRVYAIDMSTRQFDAYLRLEDAAGKQLAEDDDSGGNLDARIVFRAPQTGVYRVITTSFAPNAQGQYLLRIQEE